MQSCSGTICIRTDRVIQAHRPDLTLVNKTNKVSLIDVAVPWDSRADQKEENEEEEKKKINTNTYELSSGGYGISPWK